MCVCVCVLDLDLSVVILETPLHCGQTSTAAFLNMWSGSGSQLESKKIYCAGGIQHCKCHKRCALNFATWNIHTLVESAGGDRRICWSQFDS